MLSTATTVTDLDLASDVTSLRSGRAHHGLGHQQQPAYPAPPMIRRASSHSALSHGHQSSIESDASMRLSFPPLPPVPGPAPNYTATRVRRATVVGSEGMHVPSSTPFSSGPNRRGPAVPLTINVIAPHAKRGVVASGDVESPLAAAFPAQSGGSSSKGWDHSKAEALPVPFPRSASSSAASTRSASPSSKTISALSVVAVASAGSSNSMRQPDSPRTVNGDYRSEISGGRSESGKDDDQRSVRRVDLRGDIRSRAVSADAPSSFGRHSNNTALSNLPQPRSHAHTSSQASIASSSTNNPYRYNRGSSSSPPHRPRHSTSAVSVFSQSSTSTQQTIRPSAAQHQKTSHPPAPSHAQTEGQTSKSLPTTPVTAAAAGTGAAGNSLPLPIPPRNPNRPRSIVNVNMYSSGDEDHRGEQGRTSRESASPTTVTTAGASVSAPPTPAPARRVSVAIAVPVHGLSSVSNSTSSSARTSTSTPPPRATSSLEFPGRSSASASASGSGTGSTRPSLEDYRTGRASTSFEGVRTSVSSRASMERIPVISMTPGQVQTSRGLDAPPIPRPAKSMERMRASQSQSTLTGAQPPSPGSVPFPQVRPVGFLSRSTSGASSGTVSPRHTVDVDVGRRRVQSIADLGSPISLLGFESNSSSLSSSASDDLESEEDDDVTSSSAASFSDSTSSPVLPITPTIAFHFNPSVSYGSSLTFSGSGAPSFLQGL